MKKILYGILSIFMSVSMAFGCYFIAKSAIPASTNVLDNTSTSATVSGYWPDNKKAGLNPWTGGGTASDPYQISTAEELASVAWWSNVYELSNSKYESYCGEDVYYILTADIDLSAHYWIPIGLKGFNAKFNGNGHVISGLTFDVGSDNMFRYKGPEYYEIGLFGKLCSGLNDSEPAYVQNFVLRNVKIDVASTAFSSSVAWRIGSLAGLVSPRSGTPIYIANVYRIGVIACSISCSLPQNVYAGGLLGFTNYCDINECFVYGGTLSGGNATSSNTTSSLGGLVGAEYSTTIVRSLVTLDSINNKGFYNFGGIVGCMQNGGSVRGCFFNLQNYSGAEFSRKGYFGGIVGDMYAQVNGVFSCVVTAKLVAKSTTAVIGAIAGHNGADASKINYNAWCVTYTNPDVGNGPTSGGTGFNSVGGVDVAYGDDLYKTISYTNFTWNISNNPADNRIWTKNVGLNSGYPVPTWALRHVSVTPDRDISATINGSSSSRYALLGQDINLSIAIDEFIKFNSWTLGSCVGKVLSTQAESQIYVTGDPVANYEYQIFANTTLLGIRNAEFYLLDDVNSSKPTTITNISSVATITLAGNEIVNSAPNLRVLIAGENLTINPQVGYALAWVEGLKTDGTSAKSLVVDNKKATTGNLNNVEAFGKLSVTLKNDADFLEVVTLKFYFVNVNYKVDFYYYESGEEQPVATLSRFMGPTAMESGDKKVLSDLFLYGMEAFYLDSEIPHKCGYSWVYYYKDEEGVEHKIYAYEDVEKGIYDEASLERWGYSTLNFTSLFDGIRDLIDDKKISENADGDTIDPTIPLIVKHEPNTYNLTFNNYENNLNDIYSYIPAVDCIQQNLTINSQNNVLTDAITSKLDYDKDGYCLSGVVLYNQFTLLSTKYNVLYDNISANFEDMLAALYKESVEISMLKSAREIEVQRSFTAYNFYSVAKFALMGSVVVDSEIRSNLGSLVQVLYTVNKTSQLKSFAIESLEPYCNGEISLSVSNSSNLYFVGWYLMLQESGTSNMKEYLLSTKTSYVFAYSPANLQANVTGVAYDSNGVKIERRIVAKFESIPSTATVSRINGIYNISNASDLCWLAGQVSKGVDFAGSIIRLTADIDLAGVNFAPIGSESTPFRGTFDGNNYIIFNLNMNKMTQSNMGLFGYTENAIIKNLFIYNGTVAGYANVGAVVGKAKNTYFENVNNFDCSVTWYEVKFYDIYGEELTDQDASVGAVTRDYFAGLVGEAEGCHFFGCSNRAIVSAVGLENFAGLVGYSVGGIVEQCYTTTNALANGTCEMTDYYDAYGTYKTNEDVWMQIGNKWVLKVFYW